jgi:hypothetical protein
MYEFMKDKGNIEISFLHKLN